MKAKANVFAEAQKNGPSIEARFNEEKSGSLEINARKIQSEAHVSTNRSCDAIIRFLREGKLLSGFRHAQKMAEDNGRKIENADDFCKFLLMKWLGADVLYIQRRSAFLKHFEFGENHFFGALNAGGPGTAAKNCAYGEYCIIIKNEIFDHTPGIMVHPTKAYFE